MPTVHISQQFAQSFESIIRQRFSLKDKALQLRDDLVKIGFHPKLFKIYNIIPLKNGYWRVKFPPYRIILRIDDDGIIFMENIFKRKGKGDYKDYQ